MGVVVGTKDDIKGRLFWDAYVSLYNQVQAKDMTPNPVASGQNDPLYAETLSPHLSGLFQDIEDYDLNSATDMLAAIQSDPRYVEYSYYHLSDSAFSEEEQRIQEQTLTVTEFRAMSADETANPEYTAAADNFFTAIETSLNDVMREPDVSAPVPTTLTATPVASSVLAAMPAPTETITGVEPEETSPTIAVFQPQEEIRSTSPLQITVNGGNVIQWPVKGRITRNFGDDVNGQPNKGVDIAVAENTAVLSATDGTVVFAGESPQYGQLVVVKQNDANYAAYGYVDNLSVREGDVVTRDQPLASIGYSGDGANPLLHFEMRMGSDPQPVDPVEILGQITPTPAPDSKVMAVQSGGNLWDMVVEAYNLPTIGENDEETARNMAAIQKREAEIAALPENAAILLANAERAGRPQDVAAHYLYTHNKDGSVQQLTFPSDESLDQARDGRAATSTPDPTLNWAALDNEVRRGFAPAGP